MTNKRVEGFSEMEFVSFIRFISFIPKELNYEEDIQRRTEIDFLIR